MYVSSTKGWPKSIQRSHLEYQWVLGGKDIEDIPHTVPTICAKNTYLVPKNSI